MAAPPSRRAPSVAIASIPPPTVAPASPTLAITTTPAGAAVYLDGRKVGVTPLELPVPAGGHQIKLQRKGSLTATRRVTATPGPALDLRIPLVAESVISITPDPPGAKVKLNGALVGKGPVKRDGLAAGTYSYSVSADGYYVKTGKIQLKAGDKKALAVTLEAIPPPPPVHTGGYSNGGGGGGGGTYVPPAAPSGPPPGRPDPRATAY